MKKKIWCRIIIICLIFGCFCSIFLLMLEKNRTHTEMDIISTHVEIDEDDNVTEHIAIVLNSKECSDKDEIEEEIIKRFQTNHFFSTKIVGVSRCVMLYVDVYTDVHAYETGDKLFHFDCKFDQNSLRAKICDPHNCGKIILSIR